MSRRARISGIFELLSEEVQAGCSVRAPRAGFALECRPLSPRAAGFTRDADLAVAVRTDAEAEALIHRLRSSGFLIQTVVEQEAVGRPATVRLAFSPQAQTPVVDLLFASSGIETEIVAAAETLELPPALSMRVARVGHLIALKVLSRDDLRRPQDLVDLRALLRVATSDELIRARQSLAPIAARGYSRGRKVEGEMRRLESQV